MSEPRDPLPPLPSALGALFEREAKSEIIVDSARQAATFARVSRALDFALPPAPVRAPATSLTAKIAAIVALSFVAGGVVGGALVYRATQRPAPEAPVMSAPIAMASALPVASAPPVVASPPTVAISDLPTSTPSAALPAPRPSADQGVTGGLARERETLDAARAALVHGDQAEVLRKVHEHELRWPHGALEEEREVLAIQALASSGQHASAEARAARFRQRYPQSILNDAVTAALSGPR